ncbi:MAG TPA: DUF1648 domain-containing protein [Chloroflexota bacterium]|nr:DUF1648 domain-containing protein [Chloroflexota bacterium]
MQTLSDTGLAPERPERTRMRIDRLLLVLVAVAALLDGGVWLFVALRQSSLPDVLPIHYSSSGQVDRIGLRQQLFILPAIGLLTLLLNGVLSVFAVRRDSQLGYVLVCVAILVQLLLAGAAFQLMH